MNSEEYGKNLMNLLELLEKENLEIDEEYVELSERYMNTFGHNIPRAMIPASITDDQIKDAIKQCIQTKEDKLLEILNVSIDNNLIY